MLRCAVGVFSLFALGGCEQSNPCSDFPNKSCIVLEVLGARFVDQLSVTATGFPLVNALSPPTPRSPAVALPVDLAVLPGDAFMGDFTLDVRGFLGGTAIGEQAVGGRLVPAGQHVKVHVDLGGFPDLAQPSGADLAVNGDLALPPGVDLSAPPDLSSLGGATFTQANNGLFGANVTALLADFASGGAFAGTLGAGVFKTSNSGLNWVPVNVGLDGLVVTSMAMHFIGTSMLVAVERANGTAGVFRSTDGGAHWNQLINPPNAVRAMLATQDPLAQQIIVLGMETGGILRSTDNGANFTPANTGLTDQGIQALVEDPLTRGTYYAGTSGAHVFKTVDFGSTWTDLSTGLGSVLSVLALEFDPHTTDLVAGTQTGLSLLSAGTSTWTTYAPAPPSGLFNTHGLDFFQSATPDFYAATQQGVFHLDGNKTSWSNASAGLTDVRCNAIIADRSSSSLAMVGTFADGVFVTNNNGTSWSGRNNGMTNLAIASLAIDPTAAATVYAGSNHSGLFKTTSGGANWAAINNGLPASGGVDAIAVDPELPARVFAAVEDNNSALQAIFRSLDGGNSWTQVDSASAPTLAVDPHNSMNVFAGGNPATKFRRSTNGGTSFAPSESGLTSQVSSVVIDPNNSSLLYAGTIGAGVFKSTDGGSTWTPASTGIAENAIFTLAIDPVTTTTLYAAGTISIYKTVNAAGTWQATGSGLVGTGWVLRLAPSSRQVLYAAGTAGIYRSTDGAATWAFQPSDPFVHDIADLAVDPTDPETAYFAFTFGPGVLKRSR